VANVPDYGTEEVADTAIGMMLALARGIHLLNSRLRADRGPWSHSQAAPLARLRRRVLAIVGLGRIGTAMALRAKALGMDVAYYDPYKPDGYDKALGIRRVDRFEDLLAQAFVLSLHCPLTAETRNMIDGQAIARMPRQSYLINTARGGIVDTAAIPAAIASGHLAGGGHRRAAGRAAGAPRSAAGGLARPLASRAGSRADQSPFGLLQRGRSPRHADQGGRCLPPSDSGRGRSHGRQWNSAGEGTAP
jgi:hypothetical protein